MPSRDKANRKMGMPRSTLMMSSQDGAQITVFIALGISIVFTIVNVATGMAFIPAVLHVYQVNNVALPWILQVTAILNWWGIAATIFIMNGCIFWSCAWAARRFWVGISFLPLMLYMFISSVFVMFSVIPLFGILG